MGCVGGGWLRDGCVGALAARCRWGPVWAACCARVLVRLAQTWMAASMQRHVSGSHTAHAQLLLPAVSLLAQEEEEAGVRLEVAEMVWVDLVEDTAEVG